MNRSCDDRITLRMMDLYPDCLKLSVIVYGYIIPVLAIFVTVVNTLVIIVFQKPSIRSHTTMILTLIAGADIFGITCPAVIFAYHFVFEDYRDELSCGMAKLMYILSEICMDMFSMFSLWLTVLLSFIRCRCIKYPFNARHLHAKRRIVVYVISLWIVVCIVHMPSYFIFDFQSVLVTDYKTNISHVTCGILEADGLFFKSCTLRKAHVVLETVLDSIIPCLFLIYNNTVMLVTLRAANKSRCSLRLSQSSTEMIGENLNKEKQTDKTLSKEAKSHISGEYNKNNGNHHHFKSSDGKVKSCTDNSCCTDVFPKFQTQDKNKCKRRRCASDNTIDKLDSESRRTSWLIFVVSTIILLHEIPLTVANIYTIVKHINKPLPLSITGCFSVIQLLWQFISYPTIFLITTCMSKSFRMELCKTMKFGHRYENQPPLRSSKRISFLSPCLVRKFTESNSNEIIDDHTSNGRQGNIEMFDIQEDENVRTDVKIMKK